jgi:DNA polymerase III sliding clamp (beta) subunit (PCNA family)
MKVSREDLETALEQVRPGLANREMIDQSTHFAFLNGRVVTFNDEISVSHPLEGLDVEGAIQADPLYRLVKRMDAKELKVRHGDAKLTISAGRSRAEFSVQQDIRLPLEEVGEIGDWQSIPDPAAFVRALRFAYKSTSKDMSRPKLTCVHVDEGGHVESTDNLRITRFGVEPPAIHSFLIPASSVKELVRYDIMEVAEGDSWIHFRTEEGTVFSCRVFKEEDYPDVTPILDVEGQRLDLSGVGEDALDRAMVFSARDDELDEEVTIQLGDNKMVVSSQGDAGHYKETIKVDYSDSPVTFLLNPGLLKDILQHTKEAELASNRLKFAGANWEHVIALRKEG